MVKLRPGSRKGLTKLGTASRKAARRQATKQRSGLVGKHAVVHKAMSESWDKRQGPEKNMARVGLLSAVNTVRKARDSTERTVEFAKVPVHADTNHVLQKLEEEAAIPERPPNQAVHPGEKIALQKLMAKYGRDWGRMSRDLKLNYLQWTPRQLEKKITRMEKLLSAGK